MIIQIYSAAEYHFRNDDMDFLKDDIKVIAVSQDYVPDMRHDEFVSAVSAYEVNGPGYASGFGNAGRIVLSGKTVTRNPTTGATQLNANAVLWSAINVGIIGAFILIKESTNDSDSYLIAYLGPGNVTNLPYLTNGQNLPLNFSQNGIIQIDPLGANAVPLYSPSGFSSNLQIGPLSEKFPGTYTPQVSNASPSPASVTLQETFPVYAETVQLAWRFTVSGVVTYPTNGAVYKDGNNNNHVMAYDSAGTVVAYSDAGSPPASGTLTKQSGTGDNTITYSAWSA